MQHFTGLEDVREYLSGRRIQCLVCGRWFKRLQFMHLNLHNLTADGYRERFGIPWSYSLTSEPSREASRARITEANLRNLHLTKPKGRPKGEVYRKSCPAVAERWAQSAELGRDVSARRQVTVPCSGGCGTMLETTALTAVQPIHCDNCASRWALYQRSRYAQKKAA